MPWHGSRRRDVLGLACCAGMILMAIAAVGLLASGGWPFLALAILVELVLVVSACVREMGRRQRMTYIDAAHAMLLTEEGIELARLRADIKAHERHENYP